MSTAIRSVYSEQARKVLTLAVHLGDGKQGDAWTVREDPGRVVKIVFEGERPRDAALVYEALRAATEGVSGVCPMHGLVRDCRGGNVIGFDMALAKGVCLKKHRFQSAAQRRRCARGICRTYEALLAREAYPGDAHWNQWNVTPDGDAFLFDHDGISLERVAYSDGTIAPYTCEAMKQEFGEPTFFGTTGFQYRPELVTHGLAVLIYFVLTGFHPSQVLTTDGAELPLGPEIKANRWGRFTAARRGTVVPDGEHIPYESVPLRLQTALEHHFANCILAPHLRATPARWLGLLDEWIAEVDAPPPAPAHWPWYAAGAGVAALAAGAALWWAWPHVPWVGQPEKAAKRQFKIWSR